MTDAKSATRLLKRKKNCFIENQLLKPKPFILLNHLF